MDEREVERRLSARLHQRFDGVEPSMGLRMRIAADRSAGIAAGGRRWAWLAPARALVGVAAVLVVVLIAVLAIAPRLGVGPSTEASATPAPSASEGAVQSPEASAGLAAPMTYRLTPVTFEPPKAVGDASSAVIEKRLHTLGYDTFSLAMGDELTVTLPGPVDQRAVDAMLWPGGAAAFVVPQSKAGGLAVGQLVPTGLTPVFTNADVAGLDSPQGQEPEQTLDVSLNSDASVRVEAATTANVGGTIAMADGDGRIHFLVTIQSPITRDSGLVITGGGDSAAESIDVLAAALDSDPLPPEWSAASVAVSPETGGATLIAVRATTPVESGFSLDAGHFVRMADLFVPESGTQCHLGISLDPVDGGASIALESLSVAPGSGIQSGPEGIDIAAGTYRLGVTSECSGWAFRLHR